METEIAAISTRLIETFEKEMTCLRSTFPLINWADAINVVVGGWHNLELTSSQKVQAIRLLRGLHGLSTETVLDKPHAAREMSDKEREALWWNRLDK